MHVCWSLQDGEDLSSVGHDIRPLSMIFTFIFLDRSWLSAELAPESVELHQSR